MQQTEINDNGKPMHMFFQAITSGEHIKHEEATGNLLNSKGRKKQIKRNTPTDSVQDIFKYILRQKPC